MKRKLLIPAFCLIALSSFAQSGFWTENFNNGCNNGCQATAYTGPNGAWTQTITGTEGTDPNEWFVSCAENNNGAGNCGSGCGSAPDQTLHISAKPGNQLCPNDCGASYDAGGLCGLLTCPQTSRRIESPTINCSAANSTISVSFIYMSAGAAPNDLCNLWYYDGMNWSLVQALAATNNSGCSGQGRWTSISIALPQSAIGNANVKIGFEWKNNDDGVGTDPSVAIDDVSLGVASGINAAEQNQFAASYDYASGKINIRNASGETGQLFIYSNDGKIVLSRQINPGQQQLAVGELAPGLYILRFSGSGMPVKIVIP